MKLKLNEDMKFPIKNFFSIYDQIRSFIFCAVQLHRDIIKDMHNHPDNFYQLTSNSNSHKKRKDSLEGSLDRILLAAELEFPKVLVPRLPQHTSNVNIECAGKSEWPKQLCYLFVTSFLEH